jgi:hypothetical protein
MTEPDEVIDETRSIDPDETAALADDLVTTLDVLVDELDLDDADASGPMGIGPSTAINFLRPAVKRYATENPEATKAALARLSLETEALAREHTPVDGDPRRDLLR